MKGSSLSVHFPFLQCSLLNVNKVGNKTLEEWNSIKLFWKTNTECKVNPRLSYFTDCNKVSCEVQSLDNIWCCVIQCCAFLTKYRWDLNKKHIIIIVIYSDGPLFRSCIVLHIKSFTQGLEYWTLGSRPTYSNGLFQNVKNYLKIRLFHSNFEWHLKSGPFSFQSNIKHFF